MAKNLFKTVITIEVLSEGRYVAGSLYDIYQDTMEGSCSGIHEQVSSELLTEEEAQKECDKHGTDIEFFDDEVN
jgi:hypothetical protein